MMNKGVVYALWDYEAQNSDELSFHEGDAITILRRKDENETEWWWARLGDREGYVPKNLLGVSALSRFPRVRLGAAASLLPLHPKSAHPAVRGHVLRGTLGGGLPAPRLSPLCRRVCLLSRPRALAAVSPRHSSRSPELSLRGRGASLGPHQSSSRHRLGGAGQALSRNVSTVPGGAPAWGTDRDRCCVGGTWCCERKGCRLG